MACAMNLLSVLWKALAWIALGMLVVPGSGSGWALEAGPKRENRTEVKRQAERKVEQRRESTRERQQVRERARERTADNVRRTTPEVRTARPELRQPRPNIRAGKQSFTDRKGGGWEKSYTVAPERAKFASGARRERHFRDHGKQFGSRTSRAYEQRAARFMGGQTRAGVMQGTRPRSGDVVRYDPKTREFGVITREGKIRTYYRLSRKQGTAYFEKAWRTEPARRINRPRRPNG